VYNVGTVDGPSFEQLRREVWIVADEAEKDGVAVD